MTITTCPKCGSMNITTAGTCANCGWSQFAQVTVSSGVYETIGELEIKMSGKALLDDYKRLLFENNSLTARIAELEAENIRLGIEYQRMRLALGDIAISSKRALNESPTDHLTARLRQERQEDKSSNDTQTSTIAYGKESEDSE